MKALRVIMSFSEKEGFSESNLKAAAQKSLREVDLKLLGFDYKKDYKDLCADIPELSKKLSVCAFLIEYKAFPAPIPYHQIALGSISTLMHEYPYFESFGVDPDWVEI